MARMVPRRLPRSDLAPLLQAHPSSMVSRPFPHFPRWLRLGLLVGAAFLLATAPFLAVAFGLRADFLAFYTAGYAVQQGQAARLYDVALFREWQVGWVGLFEGTNRFVYLPFFAASYLPLAALPLGVARGLWGALGLLAVGVALRLSRQWSGLTGAESVAALLAFPPLYAALLVGQNTPLTLALLAAIGGLEWRGKAAGRGGLLAALALYKPQLLASLLVAWLAGRRRRALAAFGVGAGAVIVGSFLVSPAATRQFLFEGRRVVGFAPALAANSSLYAELGRVLPSPLAVPVFGAMALALLAALALVWRRAPQRSPYAQAMLWLAPLLATPYVANYDLLLLVLPLSFLAPRLPGDRPMQAMVALVWVGTLFNIVGPARLATWAALALFALCFRRSMKDEV